jgi:tetratricopeptide (TPR) repeat protein
MLEAMNADAYYSTSVTYYDVLLAGKSMRDPDSVEMLNIIRSSRTMDTELVYNFIGLSGIYTQMLDNKSSDILASSVQRSQKAAEKLEQIAGSRYATAQTFYNLACVYTDLKRFDSAAAVLETMQQQYPEDYRTYAGLTYLEYRRNHGNPSSRFAEYYQMAKSRYDALTGAEDGLMIWLAERYEIGDY